jgi:phospholipid/cholesterol/gamma-HCH transport system substrate-binding protein
MATAIRKHLRDFIAIAFLVLIALAVGYYIIQEQRLRIPVLEEKPFELKAEFETAQAVVPGQGQTIRVAGVRIGDVQEVELENGVAVVTFAVDREFLPVYRDATVQLRPTTGLKDMFFQLDPGTKSAGEVEDGGTLPVSNTAPDVNLDQILEGLDSDTQAYLRLLLVGAGKGLEGRDKDLGELLGSLGPINRDLKVLNQEVATRRQNLANLIHNFNVLTRRVGQADDDLAQLVNTSNAALGAIAEQDPNVQRAVALLPGTLTQARETLSRLTTYADVLGPTFNELRPFGRNLDEMNASVRELAASATPVLDDEIRPFVRAARDEIPNLRKASKRFNRATPPLTKLGEDLNEVVNMAAFNPRGAEPVGTEGRDEGYLYWLAWLGHNGSSVFSSGDGNGWWRRIYFTVGCSNVGAILAVSPLAPAVTGLCGLVAPGGPCDPSDTPGGLPEGPEVPELP